MNNITPAEVNEVVTQVIVDKLSDWNETADESVMDESIAQLQLDSLDSLEITHELERRLHVQADTTVIATFGTLREYVPYFQSLLGAA